MNNSTEYFEYIKEKYIQSNEIYSKVFNIDEPHEKFLRYVEKMNVYPLFPRAVIMPIKKPENNFKLIHKINSKFSIDLSELQSFHKLMENKVKEQKGQEIKEFSDKIYKKQTEEGTHARNIRKYFDYEIRDKVSEFLPHSHITNAWCKLYEILTAYDMFNDLGDIDTIETFHICEHPGAFIYATRDYIDQNIKKKHKFTFQSLKPGKDKQIFKAEKQLLEEYRGNLDYGKDGTGDITNVENIKYYIEKYHYRPINLITSDCGLDCSKDVLGQERDLLPIFMGALLCALGVANKGCHYVSKIFSFSEFKTIEMLYIGSYFFESAEIIRPLTTRTGSAEVYVMYKNFKFNHDDEEFIDLHGRLMKYYENYDKNTNFIDFIDRKFVQRVHRFSLLLYMTRITNSNLLLFRLYNKEYVAHNIEVKVFIKHMADYLADYYVKHVGLDKKAILQNII